MALEVWSKSGLNGLLHGHLHHTAVYDLNELYQLNASHAVLEIHAGTATSYRLHGGLPNSFNVIHSNCAIAHYSFNNALADFVLNEKNAD